MTVTVVRYRTKPDRADENQAFVEKVFAELAAERPDGSALHDLPARRRRELRARRVGRDRRRREPADGTPAFGAFQQEIADRCEEGPIVDGGDGRRLVRVPDRRRPEG